MMYVLHVNEIHEMWQDAARGKLRLRFIYYNLMATLNTAMP